MPLMTTTTPTTSIGGNALKGSKPSEPVQRSTPADPPKKAADQLAASLQAKETKRGVSSDGAARVGGAKSANEQRLDRSPDKGIDKVSISQQALQAAKSTKPEPTKRTTLDSAVKPKAEGAPGNGAGLPRIKADDPTRLGKDAAYLSHESRPGQKAPSGISKPQFSVETGVSFGGKG